MKVYVITSGEYSDYGIVAVALDKDEAERKCALLNDKGRWGDYCEIEEYDTEDIKANTDIEVKECFEMRVLCKDGKEEYFSRGCLVTKDFNKISVKTYSGKKQIEAIATFSKGISDEKARKILFDRIAKYKAEKANL